MEHSLSMNGYSVFSLRKKDREVNTRNVICLAVHGLFGSHDIKMSLRHLLWYKANKNPTNRAKLKGKDWHLIFVCHD